MWIVPLMAVMVAPLLDPAWAASPPNKEREVLAHAGRDVILPCKVDVNQCGTLHSVKWYRDTSRIYVFSQTGQVARAEGDATERMTVEYNETANETLLKIRNVEVEDEATYKCEITYLEVRENCDLVQIVRLVTLVKPTSVRILGNNGQSLTNSTVLDAKDEGSEVEVICEAAGGKPVPSVSWYNGTVLLKRASYTANSDANGVGTGISKLELTLSRSDLNARLECRVESLALDEPILSWITVDVNVRPKGMKLTGVSGHVIQGTTVNLTCSVFEARPAALVRWFNGSQVITESTWPIETYHHQNRDGTITTRSSLIFQASRWENEKTFHCYAENQVTKDKQEPAAHNLAILDVRFPPMITVKAAKTVVSENDTVMFSCTYYANPQKLLAATWLRDGKNFTRVAGKHEYGNIHSPSLYVRNINRDDMGEYTCWLKNEVGEEESKESIFLDVHYAPDVAVIMEPSAPVKALDRENVTLECNVTMGNPPALRKVLWLLNGDAMRELPECNYTADAENAEGGPFCGIDPSILSLIKVDENFAGNYSCRGENEAGYGPESQPQELIVYYPPSPARLAYDPTRILKKRTNVTLDCSVEHPGRPDNLNYVWYRGPHLIPNVTSQTWTIHAASLETRSNFTCFAQNEGGQSQAATVSLEVLAPPALIGINMNSYKGVLYSSQNVSLTCTVECYPLCSVIWYIDGARLLPNNHLYYVNVTKHGPNYSKGEFESVESTLVWNLTNWPNQQLKKDTLAQYTCVSVLSGPQIGPPVNWTTEVAVDFPPEDLHVSQELVNVTENELPQSVKCDGRGRPKLSYVWKKDAGSDEVITKDNLLQLDKMNRAQAGTYTCEAYNKYGNQTANVYFNVLYRPDCSIEIGERDDSPALICTAKANPSVVTFTWKIRETNDTISESSDNIVNENLKSYLVLDSSSETTSRTYQCVANNQIGASIPCERYVPGIIPWYIRLGRDNLIIMIVAIVALIVCVIIVCVVIICLCRKRRSHTKLPNRSSAPDEKNWGVAAGRRPLSTPPSGGTSAASAAAAAVPLRPANGDPSTVEDRGFYENLPFHGVQQPPHKPYKPYFSPEMEYADVDYHYGPINYKAASIYAAMKKNKADHNKLEEVPRGGRLSKNKSNNIFSSLNNNNDKSNNRNDDDDEDLL